MKSVVDTEILKKRGELILGRTKIADPRQVQGRNGEVEKNDKRGARKNEVIVRLANLIFVHGQKGEPMDDLISRQAAIDANTRAVER